MGGGFSLYDAFYVIAASGVAMVLFAVWTVLSGARRIAEGLHARAWPAVEGTIIESRLGSRLVDAGRRARRVYVPEIVYHYEAAGRSYTSDRVAIGRLESGFAAVARRIVDEHVPGDVVTVHHHPVRPELAVLITGPQMSEALPLAGAAVAGAIGSWLAHLAWSHGVRFDGLLERLRHLVGS
jgi:hypothetical protein